jgi:hypothetical protein
MSSTEEFGGLREWFAQWKQDNPLTFWVALLLPWVFAIVSVAVPATLISAFPFSDAKQSLNLPAGVEAVATKSTCKLPSGTYIFGYELAAKNEQGKLVEFGRICRDVINGGWAISLNYYYGR